MAFSLFQMTSSHLRSLSLLHVIIFLQYFLSCMACVLCLLGKRVHYLQTGLSTLLKQWWVIHLYLFFVWILRIPSITFFTFLLAFFLYCVYCVHSLLLRQIKSTNWELNALPFLQLFFTGWLVAWFLVLAKSHLIWSRKNDE